MTTPMLVNLSSLLDDAKCFDLVRQHRWPDGGRCPACQGTALARDGHDDTQRHRQRYRCNSCNSRFDDLTGPVLAGHHQPLRVWVLCLYFMGLNRSHCQIAHELDLAESDVQAMTEQLRTGITTKLPPVPLAGVVDGAVGSKARPAVARGKRKATDPRLDPARRRGCPAHAGQCAAHHHPTDH